MERLTSELGDRIGVKTRYGVLPAYEFGREESIVGTTIDYQNAIDKLAHYEDLEERGLLVELPCKVGDTIYSIEHRGICKKTSDYIYGNYQCLSCKENHFLKLEFYINEIKATLPIIGNLINNINNNYESGIFSVYLTREEAKKKLKEMESE